MSALFVVVALVGDFAALVRMITQFKDAAGREGGVSSHRRWSSFRLLWSLSLDHGRFCGLEDTVTIELARNTRDEDLA